MKNIKVEYIVLLETKKSFCNSIKSFNKLLETYDDIKLKKSNLISFKEINIKYEVQTGILKGKEKRFFHMRFDSKGDETIDIFSEFLRVVRDILIKVTNKQPVSLWDDISFYYANKAYPLIHEIENLMRKMLTKFAMTKFDSNWIESNIPDEVKTSTIKTKQVTNEANYLYQTDFIQLTTFLSGKIKTADVNNLLNRIKTADSISDLDFNELKDYVPTNNWDKYFSEIVDFDWEFLEKRWKKLYDLRCKVAHNNFLLKQDYDEICRLINDVKPKLLKAINELDKIVISEEDQEELAEAFASNSNEDFKEFLKKWNLFEKKLYSIISNHQSEIESTKPTHSYNPYEMIVFLKNNKIISENDQIILELVRRFRNSLVHEVDIKIEKEEVTRYINDLKRILQLIDKY